MASSAEVSGSAPITVGMVAGEASGDLLGSQLILALREIMPHLRFAGIGGPRMGAAGMDVWYPLEKLAVRGYVEVFRHFFEIASIRRRLRRRFVARPPDIFIGIDAPDFNLGLELCLKGKGIPTVHYVSPSIWMWRKNRMRLIKRAVDKILTVLPFEAQLYRQAGVEVEFVGHPLADMLKRVPPRAKAREQLKLPATAPIVALLPGSRQSELQHMADLFIQTAQKISAKLPQVIFLAPLLSRETRDLFELALHNNEASELPLTVLFGHAHEALAASDVALVASGTATLEAALLQCPMVITYKMPLASYWILRCKERYMPYFGLPNILAGDFIVPELLQHDATPDNLSQVLLNLLGDEPVRERLKHKLAEISGSLLQDAARRAAQAVLPLLRK